MSQLFHMMEDALAQVVSKLYETERRYLDIWKVDKVNNGDLF